MSWIEVQTPSRLHLGLLSWGGTARREFGGVGLMVDEPGVRLRATRASEWSAIGPLADRTLDAAIRVVEGLRRLGWEIPPLRFEVDKAPPEHVGLGVGTQMGMATARAVAEWAGLSELSASELGRLAGRGRRSGIGVHGFGLGGLIVDGGRRRGGPESPPPLVARLVWPTDWHVLVAIPLGRVGLHGAGEVHAFRDLPPPSDRTVDRLGRLVLLDLLPSVAEGNLDDFGSALGEIQTLIGQGFAEAQGGTFASEEGAEVARSLAASGLRGVGQSSWGPTVYGFSDAPEAERRQILADLGSAGSCATSRCFWTSASAAGARVSRFDDIAGSTSRDDTSAVGS